MIRCIGAKGQVVIPKELREQLGIEPGDEVSFWLHDDHVAVRPAEPSSTPGAGSGAPP